MGGGKLAEGDNIIEVKDVYKAFGPKVVLAGASLSLFSMVPSNRGAFFGIIYGVPCPIARTLPEHP